MEQRQVKDPIIITGEHGRINRVSKEDKLIKKINQYFDGTGTRLDWVMIVLGIIATIVALIALCNMNLPQ